MSFTLLSSCKPRSCSLVPSQVRQYARPAEAAAGDPRISLIRRTLYPANIRNKATPIGTWRPDVRQTLQRAIPSVQAHDTIERAWLLHKRHLRKRREEEITRKYNSMKLAMEELRKVDPKSYSEANKVEDPRRRSQKEMDTLKTMPALEGRAYDARIRGLFPRELKIPSETPSKTGWNYDWKPMDRPF